MAKVIERSIDIDASPAAVWGLPSNRESFAAWNPFMTEAKGGLAVGTKLEITMVLADAKPMTSRPTVLEVVPDRKVRCLGKVGPLASSTANTRSRSSRAKGAAWAL